MNDSSSKPFGELAGVERTVNHGLECVRVRTAEATGLVYLQGAHVAEWTPAGQRPVLWLSKKSFYQAGKALRGGVPLCFPWFGPHAEHKDYPAHGFARVTSFRYSGARANESGSPELEFTLEDDAASYRFFPHAFSARLRVTFGSALALTFTVSNPGSEPFSFEEALHSYFHVSDVRAVSVVGLQGATYHDKVRAMAEFVEEPAELRLSGETDRIYDTAASTQIVDARAQRVLNIEKANSRATVIWNPWSARAAQMADFGAEEWPEMLCVESANVGGSRITLAPGESHTLQLAVSVTAPG
jgi:glucose-6-phosphate 1-epimerase